MTRWLFIVEGAATTGWALISTFLLLDFPANTNRLSERERKIAIARLRESHVAIRTDGDAPVGKRQSFVLALRDWRTWGFILGYMVKRSSHLPMVVWSAYRLIIICVSGCKQVIVGSSTLSYFYPTLVSGLGYSDTVQAQYMTVSNHLTTGAPIFTTLQHSLSPEVYYSSN